MYEEIKEKDGWLTIEAAKASNAKVSTGGNSPWIHDFSKSSSAPVDDGSGNLVHSKVVTVVDGSVAPNKDGKGKHLRCYLSDNDGIVLGNQQVLDELYNSKRPKIVIRSQSRAEFEESKSTAANDLKIEMAKPEGLQDAELIRKLAGRAKATFKPKSTIATFVAFQKSKMQDVEDEEIKEGDNVNAELIDATLQQ